MNELLLYSTLRIKNLKGRKHFCWIKMSVLFMACNVHRRIHMYIDSLSKRNKKRKNKNLLVFILYLVQNVTRHITSHGMVYRRYYAAYIKSGYIYIYFTLVWYVHNRRAFFFYIPSIHLISLPHRNDLHHQKLFYFFGFVVTTPCHARGLLYIFSLKSFIRMYMYNHN